MPLYFVRSGNVYLNTGALRGFNGSSRTWSNTAAKYSSDIDALAYHLWFGVSIVPSAGPYDRYDGFPVRCLVY